MPDVSALKSAFDLMQLPSRIRTQREEPLPSDIVVLLQIAAGEDDVLRDAVQRSGQPANLVKEAAAFFIEQVLLFPEADHYRVLGTTPFASTEELRRNMALLLRWLHPDMNSPRSVFAGRITSAWNELKTQEKRAAYDRRLQALHAARSLARSERMRNRHGSSADARRPASGTRTHDSAQGSGQRGPAASMRSAAPQTGARGPMPGMHSHVGPGAHGMAARQGRRRPAGERAGLLDRLLFVLLGRFVH
jgi:hypothetical protein